MDTSLDNFKIILALIGGVLGWLVWEFDSLVYALLMLVVFDYVTGALLAINEKKVSSIIGFKCICKKGLISIMIALGNIIDRYIIGYGTSFRTILIMFYLSNEVLVYLKTPQK